VWIHGRQPETFSPAGALLQHRQHGSTRLYLIAAEPGPNRVAEALGGLGIRVPRVGSLLQDLERFFSEWDGGWRQEFARHETASDDAVRTSAHLVRLWAAEAASRLADAGDDEEAGRIAALYQLVTPVSGAVVLENQQQYRESGLQPADRMTVPTVPEPETWLLLALAAGSLGLLRMGRSRWLRRF
jgi:hypothetical protein